MTMMRQNWRPEIFLGKDAANAKVLRKEQRRDDTMPLCKDLGIKNSLLMQLLSTRGLTGKSANRLSECKCKFPSEGNRVGHFHPNVRPLCIVCWLWARGVVGLGRIVLAGL
jgi:hypothetical protein